MQEIFFVTGNLHKFEEVKKVMDREGIKLIKSDAKVIEQKLETEKEVSIAKALHAMKLLGKPLIVEDTGIYFHEAYENFPGPNAAVFVNGVGVGGVLKILEGKPRKAFFRTVFTFYKPGGIPMTFEGTCHGRMNEKPSEAIDFPYDTLFVPDGEERTFSEMTKEEKERYSHRAKALKSMVEWLRKEGW